MSRSESRKANATLSFRLTPDEYAAIKTAAENHGIGPTTFARRMTFKGASLPLPAHEKPPDPRKADLAKVLGQLGRIASSANQLARVSNATGTAPTHTPVLAILDELRAIRRELVRE